MSLLSLCVSLQIIMLECLEYRSEPMKRTGHYILIKIFVLNYSRKDIGANLLLFFYGQFFRHNFGLIPVEILRHHTDESQ